MYIHNYHFLVASLEPPPLNPRPFDTMYSTCTLSKRSPCAKAPQSRAWETSAMQALCASTSSPGIFVGGMSWGDLLREYDLYMIFGAWK
jgi:hypothetical protein